LDSLEPRKLSFLSSLLVLIYLESWMYNHVFSVRYIFVACFIFRWFWSIWHASVKVYGSLWFIIFCLYSVGLLPFVVSYYPLQIAIILRNLGSLVGHIVRYPPFWKSMLVVWKSFTGKHIYSVCCSPQVPFNRKFGDSFFWLNTMHWFCDP
jgi:hypothetical protein